MVMDKRVFGAAIAGSIIGALCLGPIGAIAFGGGAAYAASQPITPGKPLISRLWSVWSPMVVTDLSLILTPLDLSFGGLL